MDVTFGEILAVLKKYWTDKDGTAEHDVARKVVSLITEGLPEFKSDTTYKTIFNRGPSAQTTSKILNNLADVSKFDDYIKKNISGEGRKHLAQDLKKLTGIEMDRSTVGRVCRKLLIDSLKAGNHLKNNKNKKSPLKKSEEKKKIDVRSGIHQYINYVPDKEEIEVDGVSFQLSPHLTNNEAEVEFALPYCVALFEAYSEKAKQNITAENIEDSEYKSHFKRQQRWFNEAAWYERSLRDTVIDFDDQYNLLKHDVYEGIEPVYHDEDFGTDGVNRLKNIQKQVVILQLDRSNLKNIDNILGNDTKKGLCHVLVNDRKIKSWVKVDYDEAI